MRQPTAPTAPQHGLTRRQWIAATTVAVAGSATVNAFAIEPKRVALSRHSFGAAGAPTIRIIQLSDLHLRAVSRHEEHVAETALAARPDLILLTGDAIDRADSLPLIERFLTLLPVDTPKLAILGDREYWGQVDLPHLARIYDARNCRLQDDPLAHLGSSSDRRVRRARPPA